MTKRITYLCSSLGMMKDGEYIPSEDCKINLDELAYTIWTDDATTKNVSIQVYELGTYEGEFIPILLYCEDLSFTALKALTACTFPVGFNVANPQKHIEILQYYKKVTTDHPEVFDKILEFTADIIQNPRADQTLLNQAELALTFIRNLAVVKVSPTLHEKFFNQLYNSMLFDVIEELKITRFNVREAKFAQIIAGIIYGCFVPFLPLKPKELSSNKDPLTRTFDDVFEEEKVVEEPPKQSNADIYEMLRGKAATVHKTSSRHGHWGTALQIKSKRGGGFTYNGPITSDVLKNTPMPTNTIKPRTRARPYERHEHGHVLPENAEKAAAKVLKSASFLSVFRKVMPKSFSAYDRVVSIADQMQLAEITRFFLDFIVMYGGRLSVVPLATEHVLKYYISMETYFLDSRQLPVIDGIPFESIIRTLVNLFSSFLAFYVAILRDGIDSEEVLLAREAVASHTSEIEDFLVTILAARSKSKATMQQIQTNIVALERLFRLYELAQENDMVRRRIYHRDDEGTSATAAADEAFESYERISAEKIVVRLMRRQGILIPFFQCLKNYKNMNKEELTAITNMLRRYTRSTIGLAHLFKLPFFNIINQLLSDREFATSDDSLYSDLRSVLETAVHKFFFCATRERTMYLSLIGGCEIYEVVDEDYVKRMEDDEASQALGLSQEVISILAGERIPERPLPEHFTNPLPRQVQYPKPKATDSTPKAAESKDEGMELELSDEEGVPPPPKVADEFSEGDEIPMPPTYASEESLSSSDSESSDETTEELLRKMAERRRQETSGSNN